MSTSVDPNMIRGFQDEARGYLPPLRECLESLRSRPAEEEALAEMHRLVHLIRGASGVVGLPQLTALSEGLETYLEELGAKIVDWDEPTLGILEEAVEAIRMNLDGVEAKPSEVREPGGPVDPEIVAGFLIEAQEALELVSNHLRAVCSAAGDQALLLEVRRAVHTIKGAGGMVGLHALSGVAHRMEDLLDGLYEGRVAMEESVSVLLHRTNDLLVDLVEAGGRDEVLEAAIPGLLDEYRRIGSGIAVGEEFAVPVAVAEVEGPEASKYVRVPLERIDELVRMVSELFVHRSTFERTLGKFGHEVGELSLSLQRLERLDTSFEQEQALFQTGSGTVLDQNPDFDPLELDRYTKLHTHSRDLNETAADVGAAEAQLRSLGDDFETYLSRDKRLTSQIQDRLISFRMVPLSSYAARLHRTVRVAAGQTDKAAELVIDGGMTEVDKTVLEKMAGPLEHLLRNAVAHGIESPAEREAAGKPTVGHIELSAAHEGSLVVLRLSDDGAGLNLGRIRERAIRGGLLSQEQASACADEEVYRLMFLPGFSTFEEITELAGRGIGLDVVKSTVEEMKGTLSVESVAGQGTSFLIRLPMTMAITRVLMVEARQQLFAIPIAAVREVSRISQSAIEMVGGQAMARFSDRAVPLHSLGGLLQLKGTSVVEAKQGAPVALLRNGDGDFALSLDRILEARDIVVKPLSGLLGQARHLAGATILGDGSIVPILNPAGLSNPAALLSPRAQWPVAVKSLAPPRGFDILIVDDSLSVRRVIATLLERQGWTSAQAKDGVEALEHLRKVTKAPDLILMDVEMPRMDGFELTAALRAQAAFVDVPIVMLTSRSGEKHRTKAFSVGVTDYLVKPYQDEHLLATIRRNIERVRRRMAS